MRRTGLDRLELDAETAHLDLPVDAPHEPQVSRAEPHREIARLVHQRRRRHLAVGLHVHQVLWRRRRCRARALHGGVVTAAAVSDGAVGGRGGAPQLVGHKLGGGEVVAVQVAARDARAEDDLARDADRHRLVLRVHKHDDRVLDRLADEDVLAAGTHHEPRHRPLSGSVEVVQLAGLACVLTKRRRSLRPDPPAGGTRSGRLRPRAAPQSSAILGQSATSAPVGQPAGNGPCVQHGVLPRRAWKLRTVPTESASPHSTMWRRHAALVGCAPPPPPPTEPPRPRPPPPAAPPLPKLPLSHELSQPRWLLACAPSSSGISASRCEGMRKATEQRCCTIQSTNAGRLRTVALGTYVQNEAAVSLAKSASGRQAQWHRTKPVAALFGQSGGDGSKRASFCT